MHSVAQIKFHVNANTHVFYFYFLDISLSIDIFFKDGVFEVSLSSSHET